MRSIINKGLFPVTIFVCRDFVIDIGQLKPKQINIIASYILISRNDIYQLAIARRKLVVTEKFIYEHLK